MDKQHGAVASTDQFGQDPERAAFARWCRENGHGELDDMLTPLHRSLRALMWPVWQGAVAAERERMRALIDDDASAITYQTMGKYRSALLRALKA